MKTILIVDDDKAILTAMTYILEEEGYVVIGLSGGEKLESTLKTHRPALVIMDILMPGIHGHLLALWMRQHKEFATIPVVLMSASHEARKTALQVGITHCLDKPFEIDDLLRLVQRLTD